jgi:hypothetical protein
MPLKTFRLLNFPEAETSWIQKGFLYAEKGKMMFK